MNNSCYSSYQLVAKLISSTHSTILLSMIMTFYMILRTQHTNASPSPQPGFHVAQDVIGEIRSSKDGTATRTGVATGAGTGFDRKTTRAKKGRFDGVPNPLLLGLNEFKFTPFPCNTSVGPFGPFQGVFPLGFPWLGRCVPLIRGTLFDPGSLQWESRIRKPSGQVVFVLRFPFHWNSG